MPEAVSDQQFTARERTSLRTISPDHPWGDYAGCPEAQRTIFDEHLVVEGLFDGMGMDVGDYIRRANQGEDPEVWESFGGGGQEVHRMQPLREESREALCQASAEQIMAGAVPAAREQIN